MRRNALHTFILVAVALACCLEGQTVAARSKKKAKAVKTAVTADTLSYADSRRFGYFFLEAVNQQNAGHYAAAFDLLNHCLDINPNAAEVYFMRSRYYGSLHKDSLALRDLETAARLQPSNSTYQESVAQQYIGTGNFAKATEAYEELLATHRDRDDVVEILIQLYRQQKDYPKMLSAINRLEQIDGSSDQLTMMRMNAYEMMGDEKHAYATLKGLADSHPNDLNFSLMLGNWLMQHKRPKEAYAIYQSVMKTEPDNAMVQGAMYDYYRATSQDTLASGMMQRILLGKNTPSATRVQFLRQAIQDNEKRKGDSTEIINLIRDVQRIVPADTLVAQIKVAYYSMKNLPKDTIDAALTSLLKLQPDNAGARLQLIQDRWGNDNWKEIAQLSEPGMMYNPDEMVFYFFTGLSRYYLKDEDGALDALKRGATEINDQSNTEMVANLYSIMGEIYHNKNMKNEAYAAYDSCLIYKPDNVITLNNYAYYLSLDGTNLQKAEEMSAKAVKAEPKNATYLDTYAWILYMEKRYAEAKVYIDLALKNSGDSLNDGTLYEHAGDIYVELHDYPAAVGFYQQAILKGSDAKALNRKINLYKKRK